MPLPKAYQPQDGYKYQILCRYTKHDRSWEHCDYAKDRAELKHLLGEYELAYRGTGHDFKTITLPRKYWPRPVSCFSARSRSRYSPNLSVNLGVIV